MGRDIPLGRIAGVKVGMSWVVPFVALLYAVSLAQGQLPNAVPGQPDSSYWIVGGLGAVLFFASLLAHEMGHALVARREGIGVEGVSLWLLGGIARLSHEPDTAGKELRISGIGPVASGACALAFWFAGLALDGGFGLFALLAELFLWLAVTNALLALFNLLPGAPLDGGGVLAAVLWMATRDRTRSQTIAAVIGLALGVALTVLGVLFLVDGGGNGIWLVVVGVFIAGAARERLRAGPTLGVLRQARAADVMVADPPVLPEWSTVQDVVRRADDLAPHRSFPVQSADGRITGLLTAEAVMAVAPERWPALRVTDLAFPIERVPIALVDEPVLTTIQRTRENPSGRVLVLWPDGRVAGVLGADAAGLAIRQATAREAQAPT